jgi:DeoD family purine-nucleoside phosphorylase
MPIHLRAEKGDYAATVLLVGDPDRSKQIAQMIEGVKVVNENRGLLGYTGTYKGKSISVQTTAMGCPSAAIVMEELIQLDVQRFIRIGTCGGIGVDIKPLDFVAAVAAAPFDGTTRTYLAGAPHAPYATFGILKTAYDVAEEMGVRLRFTGIASVDVFYNPFGDYVQKLREKGLDVVEMETSLIYYLANRSKREAASFLLVSDIVGGGESFTEFVSDKALAEAMENLIRLVLETAIRLD